MKYFLFIAAHVLSGVGWLVFHWRLNKTLSTPKGVVVYNLISIAIWVVVCVMFNLMGNRWMKW